MTGKGIDAVTTELCVTAPMDAGGYARPRVLLGAFWTVWCSGFGLTVVACALDVTNALRRLGIMVFKVRTCVLACDAQCADTKHVCRPISTQRACLASRFRRFTAFCSPTPTASRSTILSFVTES